MTQRTTGSRQPGSRSRAIGLRPAEPRPADSRTAGSRTTERWYGTPFGYGRVELDGDLPVAVELPDPAAQPAAGIAVDDGLWPALLARYFAGERVDFPLDVEAYVEHLGCTAFEADVLRALARVPYGRAVSYRDLARDAGHPTAWRATGTVMARNELPIVLPCHRVTRSDGTLGFYGNDPAWKRRLLELEGVLLPETDGARR